MLAERYLKRCGSSSFHNESDIPSRIVDIDLRSDQQSRMRTREAHDTDHEKECDSDAEHHHIPRGMLDREDIIALWK